MPPIDLTRDVKEATENKDPSKILADLDFLHRDPKTLKAKVDATNLDNQALIARKVIPPLEIVDDTKTGTETVKFGGASIEFKQDGTVIKFGNADQPNNPTEIERTDGSTSRMTWSAEGNKITVLVNIDKYGNQTQVEAKDGVTIECDKDSGVITTSNPDGTKTVQRTDGVVEHRDQDNNVVSYSDSSGRSIAMNSAMQGSVNAATGRAQQVLAQISSSDPSRLRDCMDQLYAILAELDPYVEAPDPSVAAAARSAHVLVSSTMAGAESRISVPG